jgi:hypothetical protein
MKSRTGSDGHQPAWYRLAWLNDGDTVFIRSDRLVKPYLGLGYDQTQGRRTTGFQLLVQKVQVG